jgi:hypothetical protein
MHAARGYDVGKKINGIKDTSSSLMVVLITTACAQDRNGARLLLGR